MDPIYRAGEDDDLCIREIFLLFVNAGSETLTGKIKRDKRKLRKDVNDPTFPPRFSNHESTHLTTRNNMITAITNNFL